MINGAEMSNMHEVTTVVRRSISELPQKLPNGCQSQSTQPSKSTKSTPQNNKNDNFNNNVVKKLLPPPTLPKLTRSNAIVRRSNSPVHIIGARKKKQNNHINTVHSIDNTIVSTESSLQSSATDKLHKLSITPNPNTIDNQLSVVCGKDNGKGQSIITNDDNVIATVSVVAADDDTKNRCKEHFHSGTLNGCHNGEFSLSFSLLS